MRKLLLKAAILMGTLSLWNGSALAMPLGRALLHTSPDVIQADWQCGRGWHVTSWGTCRPDRRLGYRFSSWPYRYDGYRADAWSDEYSWPHDDPSHDDDTPPAYDWSWDH
ncbi:GCG_CRPN prefix-to-repeats domain-containing protein [Rhodopseudomonas parapalustris]